MFSVWDLASLVVWGFRQTGIARKQVIVCRGNDKAALNKLHCNLSCQEKNKSKRLQRLKLNSLLQGRVVLQVATDGFAHHGVFAHQYHSLVSQRQTDGLHLLGADIVCTHNEAFWIVIQKLLQVKKINYQHKGITKQTELCIKFQ